MKKILIILLVVASIAGCKNKPVDKMDWWKDAKFGMFIHWGLYSVPAGEYEGKEIAGIGEWIMSNAHIPVDTYANYANQFNPEKFNAEEIVLLAKNAGMKYIIITSKHHDGFAMFKSNVSKYNIFDATPFKRDVVAEMAAACKKYGIAFGLYYSQSQDWHHAGGAAMNGQWDEKQKGSYDTYLDSIAVPQVKEILNNYGDIKVLWWDTPVDMTPERAAKFMPELAKHPSLIYNNRLGGGIDGDLETPEQYIPATGFPGKNWESCMTMNDTWGFKKNDHNWKSTETIVQNLIDIASKGGNYLLNIGPTNEGLVPEASVKCLQDVGAWMKLNGKAIYETKASPFKKLDWGRCTQKANGKNTLLYFHVFDMPATGKLIVPGLSNKIVKAYALNNEGDDLNVNQEEACQVIDVSKVKADKYATVLVAEIEGNPVVYDSPEIKANYTNFIDSVSFEIVSGIQGAVVKYNFNERVNDKSALEANRVIKLAKNESFSVYAANFLNGKQVSGISVMNFIKVTPLKAQQVKASSKGLKYNYYDGKWSVLPDFSKLKPLQTGISNGLDLSVRKSNNDYAVVYDGFVSISQSGVYKLLLTSDDGSRLTIDGEKILNNDGLHGMDEKTLEVALEKGLHKIKVEFFQGGGGDGLILKLQYKDEKPVEIATSAFVY